VVAKVIAIFSHLAVISGIVAIGYWHFGNIKTGIGTATMYLMLPYTAQMTGHIEHVIPGGSVGLGRALLPPPPDFGHFHRFGDRLVYYPLFLLPLWISFYWRKGVVALCHRRGSHMLVVMAILLSSSPRLLTCKISRRCSGFGCRTKDAWRESGVWAGTHVYRIPVLAAFIAMSGTLAIWPAQKNLGTLLSCSAAVMVATQFWHGFGGGLYIGWYLPLLLLTIFRPNLEDRIALVVLGEDWLPAPFDRCSEWPEGCVTRPKKERIPLRGRATPGKI
jgi:hypothetical protein